jgi:riboflavin synthase
MFTGIIESMAEVQRIDAGTVVVTRPPAFTDLKIGCSIAVSGVCLSVTAFDEKTMSFDLAETTVQKTTLGSMHVGDQVHVERPLRADGRFDGHIVQGHVEGVGEVVAAPSHTDAMLRIRVPSRLLPFVVHHGSITLDGVSLTVAELEQDIVSVALIPLTMETTTLSRLAIGDTVNIETDILAKYLLSNVTA